MSEIPRSQPSDRGSGAVLNEEEVKVKIVLPWLAARGLSVGSLQLETTLNIRVGRQELCIGKSNGADEIRRSRLDILVRRGSENLMVIEVKGPKEELSSSDRDQAISYARLIHPIAPFALVTNGQEFCLYDVITRDALDVQVVDVGVHRAVSLSDESRRQALRLFLEEIPEGLLTFAQQQIETEIRPLVGRPTDFGAVYIPEAHVPRQPVLASVDAFLQSDAPAFVIVAEAGMGKTCAAIDIARHVVKRGISALFLRGRVLERRLQDAINEEFEWVYGSDGDGPVVRWARESPRPLVVVVDGLEDWAYEGKVQEVTNLLKHLRRRNVKLVLTCKERYWRQFIELRGSRTGVESGVFKNSIDDPVSLRLPIPNTRELHDLIDRFRNAFGVSGGIEAAAFDQAKRSPFMLRLLFQVAAARSRREHITFDSPQFFEQYLALATRGAKNADTASRTLTAIATLMATRNREWIEEEEARALLGLGVDDEFVPELFDQKLLISEGPPGAKRLTFGFSQIRSHLIASRVRQWPKRSVEDFVGDVEAIAGESVMAEALEFYYPSATPAQRAAVDGDLRRNAERYLHLYRQTIGEYLPSLRQEMPPAPRPDQEVGFVAEILLQERRLGFYGFRAISAGDDEVLFLPADRADDGRPLRTYYYGARSSHLATSANGFRELDVESEVIRREIVPALHELIEKGHLIETDPVLRGELVRGAVEKYKDVFARLTNGPTAKAVVQIGDLWDALRRAQLKRHFEEELVEQWKRSGRIREIRSGRFVSFHYSFSPADRRSIDERVDRAVAMKLRPSTRSRSTELEALKSLLERLADSESAEEFELTNVDLQLMKKLRSGEVSLREVRPDVTRLLVARNKDVLRAYQQLVESNFRELWKRFGTLRPPAVTLLLQVIWRDTIEESIVNEFWCKPEQQHHEVRIVDRAELERDVRHPWPLSTPVGRFVCTTFAQTGLGNHLWGPYLNLDVTDSAGGVRSRVYNRVLREFAEISREWIRICQRH